MRLRGYSIIDALRVLRKEQPWACWWADRSEAELQTRYQEALQYWEPIFNELAAIEVAEDEIYRPFED